MKLKEHVKDYDLEKIFNIVGIMTYLQHLAPRALEGCNTSTPPSEQVGCDKKFLWQTLK